MSHDPDLRLSERAQMLDICIQCEPNSTKRRKSSTINSSPIPSPAPAPAPANYTLHNKDAVFADFPHLRTIYERHVERRLGKLQKGLRNLALTELIADLFYVIHPRFVLLFAEAFYDLNSEVFEDYGRDNYTREARAMLDACLTSYSTKRITPSEAEIYHSLANEEERAAFRICRSLAACPSDDPTICPPRYFIPSEHLGVRLGVTSMTAWRILRDFEELGIIDTVVKGRRRDKAQSSRATVYEWRLVGLEELTAEPQ